MRFLISFLTVILFNIIFSPSSDCRENRYCKHIWESAKVSARKTVETVKIARPLESQLLNYYYKKYPQEQKQAVKRAVMELMPQYDSVQVADCMAEVLSYRHLIYHETRWHKLDKNIEIAKEYKDLVISFCEKYDLRPSVALAVISWENSGNISKISYAECAGLGQMSVGAVKRSHEYAMKISRKLKKDALKLKGEERARLLAKADSFNLDAKHKALCKHYNIKDERLIPECNAEDAVIYLKILEGYFAGRSDLAISAYHNGVKNNDDLIRALPVVKPSDSIPEAIERNNITYLTLWQNNKTRNMLNGHLTMDEELTTIKNASEALGDESDIYPWKVMGAYAAYLQNTSDLINDIKIADTSIEELECAGLAMYDTLERFKQGIKEEKLIKIEANMGGKYKSYFVTPELAGFLLILRSDIAEIKKNKKFYLPLNDLLGEEYLDREQRRKNNLQGVACSFNLEKHPFASIISKRLDYYYLHDKIYLKRRGNILNICLNPRYGLEFYEASRHLPRGDKTL